MSVRERRRHCHAPLPLPRLQIVLVGFDGFKPGQPKHYFENFEPWRDPATPAGRRCGGEGASHSCGGGCESRHERVLGWFIEDLIANNGSTKGGLH